MLKPNTRSARVAGGAAPFIVATVTAVAAVVYFNEPADVTFATGTLASADYNLIAVRPGLDHPQWTLCFSQLLATGYDTAG
jgi:hypothetical protein